jgi:uncharacterized protein YbjT (DUF2867 family)
MKKALLFGASGFIGSFLLEELLNSADYETVTIVVRKKLSVTHSKLKTIIGDYHTLPSLKNELVADDVFIAIGTTKANTPDKREYYQIDHDYPVLAAKLAKESGATSVAIVTAVGANAASGMFYIKMKGEIERDITALNFNHTHIFRPSMLMGNRQEKRALEKILIRIFSVINPLFVGSLSKYRGISGKEVAKAMLNAARHPTEKVKLYEWKEMKALL